MFYMTRIVEISNKQNKPTFKRPLIALHSDYSTRIRYRECVFSGVLLYVSNRHTIMTCGDRRKHIKYEYLKHGLTIHTTMVH